MRPDSPVLFHFRWRESARHVSAAGVLVALLCASGTQAAEVISIGTGPPGGPWYACGGAMADIISSEVKGVKASAQVTGAAVANMKLLGAGEVRMGFTINTIARQAYEGKWPFEEEYTDIRAIISGFTKGYLQIFTLAESDLEYVSQIKGRTVVPGPAGHGSLIRLREVFRVLGYAFEDIKPVYLPYSQALAALGDGKVDAVVLYVPMPAPPAKQFSLGKDIRLLRLREDEIDRIQAVYPHYERLVIPGGSYRGQEEEVWTVGTSNGVYGSADMDEEIVYRVTKAIFENIERLRTCHPSARKYAAESAPLGSLIPFHPGAIRFYKEAGVWPGEQD